MRLLRDRCSRRYIDHVACFETSFGTLRLPICKFSFCLDFVELRFMLFLVFLFFATDFQQNCVSNDTYAHEQHDKTCTCNAKNNMETKSISGTEQKVSQVRSKNHCTFSGCKKMQRLATCLRSTWSSWFCHKWRVSFYRARPWKHSESLTVLVGIL